jgi:hypothetical protein
LHGVVFAILCPDLGEETRYALLTTTRGES